VHAKYLSAVDPLTAGAVGEAPSMGSGTLGTINVNVNLQSNAKQVSQEIADKIGDEVSGIIHTATVNFADSVSIA
jgi:hypothetical protein